MELSLLLAPCSLDIMTLLMQSQKLRLSAWLFWNTHIICIDSLNILPFKPEKSPIYGKNVLIKIKMERLEEEKVLIT